MSSEQTQTSILVADDVFTNIEFLRYILRKENYEILPVTNGVEALQTVQNNKVDLILLDVMMPELDGFEVCRHLKENPDTRDIPVIFLTARTDIESTVKGFELGAVDYVTKPFHRQELLARVKTHIELQKAKLQYRESSSVFAQKLSFIQSQTKKMIESLESGDTTQALGLAKEMLSITDAQ